MKLRRILRRPAHCAIVMASLGAALAAQDKPDFSGSWTLESGSPGADIPRTLSVSQSLVRTNVRGEPVRPFFKNWHIEDSNVPARPSPSLAAAARSIGERGAGLLELVLERLEPLVDGDLLVAEIHEDVFD